MNGEQLVGPAVSVAVVGICGPQHLLRCLDALAVQRGAPAFEVVVAYDPSLQGMDAVARLYPEVRLSANQGQHTPLELASRALQNSRGEVVLLTEDHCIPEPDWVCQLNGAFEEGCAAVGGVVQSDPEATATDWAFYYVDFFRYADPVQEGPSPSLTVCNVAYRRRTLEEIDPSWKDFFHETAVNDELRAKFGPLKLFPGARVTMRRHVRFADALRERYAFGRLFGCTRMQRTSPLRRVLYTLGAPLLPGLLMGRMVNKSLRDPALRARLAHSILPLVAMVFAWSLGEWFGYLTRRRPRDLTVAGEVPDPNSRRDDKSGGDNEMWKSKQ